MHPSVACLSAGSINRHLIHHDAQRAELLSPQAEAALAELVEAELSSGSLYVKYMTKAVAKVRERYSRGVSATQ